MIFLHVLLHSFKLPGKKATFWLNRIGMDTAVIYMFILLLIVSLPSLVDQLTATTGPAAQMNIFFLIVYFFIFNYLPMTIFVFILLSLIAYIGTGLAKLMKRKLRFQILWKMAAFTTTIPLLLYTLYAFILPASNAFLGLVLLYSLVLLIAIISVYPKRRTKTKK